MFPFQYSDSCTKNVLHSVCIGVLAFLSTGAVAHAAPMYSVAPLIIDTKAEPRDIITKTITLTNTGTQQVTVYPTVNNISLTDGGTIEEFLQPVMDDRTASLSSWIEIIRGGVDLAIGESKTLDLTLRIHPEPKPGIYHAFIGFGNGRNRDVAEKQVKQGQAPGTIVTVTIEDKRRSVLKLSKFIIDRFILKTGNQAAVYTIKNPGEESLVPRGDIIIYDSRGKEVGSLLVNENGESIDPGMEHQFTATVPTQGLFGKYKAFLSVEYGGAQLSSMQDTAFFYVLPLKKVLIILGVLAVMVVFIALYIHRRYFDDTPDADSELLTFKVRDAHTAPAQDHDINLKNNASQ